MRTSRRNRSDDIELNFIPLIDILLVVIIFLMVTTTFAKLSEIKVNLPVAEERSAQKTAEPINITITEDGRFIVNEKLMESIIIDDIAKVLKGIAGDKEDTSVIIVVHIHTYTCMYVCTHIYIQYLLYLLYF